MTPLAALAVIVLLQTQATPDPYTQAKSLAEAGKMPEAVKSYRGLLAAQPEHLAALDDLAWILATHPDPALRNPAEAERLAARLVNLTHFKRRRSTTGDDFTKSYKIRTANTLAAALAALGDYSQAVGCTLSALEMAQKLNKVDPSPDHARLLSQVKNYMELYQAKQPFISPAGYQRAGALN